MDLTTEAMSLELGDIELCLEQVADLEGLARRSIGGLDPYWAYLWPSALRLMEAMVEAPETFEGRRVLEMGCGLGGPGIVAAKLGGTVTLTDARPEAIDLTRRNAARNRVAVDARVLDWTAPAPPDFGPFEVILASDVLYDDGSLGGVLRFVRAHLAPDGVAWLADPQRVAPTGLTGACRLRGLSATHRPLRAGQTHTGGVTLYELTRRSRGLS